MGRQAINVAAARNNWVQNPERRKNGYEVLPRIFDMGLLNGCPCQVGEGSKEQLILEELVYTSHCSDFVKFA